MCMWPTRRARQRRRAPPAKPRARRARGGVQRLPCVASRKAWVLAERFVNDVHVADSPRSAETPSATGKTTRQAGAGGVQRLAERFVNDARVADSPRSA